MELLDLPAEILSGIASSLNPVKHRSTLYNLCLTSKTICAISQPVLFSTNCKAYNTEESSATHIQTLFLFARTLILRPDLSRKVKILDLHSDVRGFNAKPQDAHSSLTEDDLDIMIQTVHRLRVPNAVLWRGGLVDYDLEGIFTLLMCLVPNVKHLDLRMSDQIIAHLERMNTLRSIEGGTPPFAFTTLKSLILVGSEHSFHDILELNDIASTLSLPTLEVFEARSINEAYHLYQEYALAGPDPFKCSPRSLAISTIAIISTHFDIGGVKTLVAGCKALKKFVYEENEVLQGRSLWELTALLGSHRDTLEEVFLQRQFPHRPVEQDCTWLTPLSICSRLKTLGLDAQAAWSSPLPLPSSLQHLRLRGSVQAVENVLTFASFGKRKSELPSLTTITINTDSRWFRDGFRRPGADNEHDVLKLYYHFKENLLDGTDIQLIFINTTFPNFDDKYQPSTRALEILEQIRGENVAVAAIGS